MDQEITVSAREFGLLQRDIGEMKGVMLKMANAIDMIVRLEERQREVAESTDKILDRVDSLERRQHEADITAAAAKRPLSQLEEMRSALAALQMERERDKARLEGLMFGVRALWVFVGSSVGILTLKFLAGGLLAASTGVVK